MRALDTFTRGYLDCALWLTDEDPGSGEYQFPEPFTIGNVSPEALDEAIHVCAKFKRDHATELFACDDAKAGHDLYLTRNGHGSGFWDGDYEERIGIALTAGAHALGETSLYQGDDGLFYFA